LHRARGAMDAGVVGNDRRRPTETPRMSWGRSRMSCQDTADVVGEIPDVLPGHRGCRGGDPGCPPRTSHVSWEGIADVLSGHRGCRWGRSAMSCQDIAGVDGGDRRCPVRTSRVSIGEIGDVLSGHRGCRWGDPDVPPRHRGCRGAERGARSTSVSDVRPRRRRTDRRSGGPRLDAGLKSLPG